MVPARTWTDAQIDANSYMCVLLQGTSPAVGMYPFSVATRFVVILGAMAKGLGIENSCKVFQMALMNRRLAPEVETIFLMPKEDYSYISSRIVKEVARLGGDVTGVVPAPVREALTLLIRFHD
jgi:hypothetical protein